MLETRWKVEEAIEHFDRLWKGGRDAGLEWWRQGFWTPRKEIKLMSSTAKGLTWQERCKGNIAQALAFDCTLNELKWEPVI